MSSQTRIQQLSDVIARNTQVVEQYLEANGLPTPSLDADALWSIHISDDAAEVKEAQRATIEACSELQALMTGPKELLHFSVRRHYLLFHCILTSIL